MAEERTKTLSYHRAEYFCDNPSSINLGLCIKQATDKRHTISDRTISTRSGQYIKMAHFQPESEGGYFLHLTVETPGERASIVPKVAAEVTEFKVGTLPPPNDAEFMDGDAFVYVRRNDACLCTTTIRDGAVRYFLQKFFEESQIRKDAGQFHFLNALDASKIALLHKGVKQIELMGTLYRASIDYQKRKGQAVGIFDLISKQYKAILGKPDDFTDDSIRVEVVLKVDRRRKGGIVLGHKRLTELATGIIEHQEKDDEYVIITKDDEKIKPSEIVLHSTAEIGSIGKSVDREQAWGALFRYYNSLTESGQLEL